MSSSIIDSADTATIPSVEAGASTHHSMHRAWLVAVALLAMVTIGVTMIWQATSGTSATSAAPSRTTVAPAAQTVPVASAGAGLLALAWDLTPPSQREAVCAQFSADPAAAWADYSAGADVATIATRAELSAFLDIRC